MYETKSAKKSLFHFSGLVDKQAHKVIFDSSSHTAQKQNIGISQKKARAHQQ